MPAAREQTRIIVPTCAADALTEYCTEQGLKREPTLRALLDRYIDEQQAREPGDRITHISTVIWHPDMPRGRNHPSPYGTSLAMRLAPGAADTARTFALRLPGQTDIEGGHHDYRPRLLTDAVVTAIAAQCSFTDDVLDGLPPLLTQRAARGLFRLAIAATATRPERLIYERADAEQARVESGGAGSGRIGSGRIDSDAGTEHAIDLAVLLRSSDIAWHGPYRREVTRHLARELLTGDEGQANLAMLGTRGRYGFEVERSLLELGDSYRDGALAHGSSWRNSYEGRGGTVVWRAERIVQIREMLDWLRTHTETADADDNQPGQRSDDETALHADQCEVDGDCGDDCECDCHDPVVDGRTKHMLEPGWSLKSPSTWVAVTRRIGDDRNHGRLNHDVTSGSVLYVRAGGTEVYWPYRRTEGPNGKLQAVPGVDTVIRAADGRPAEQTIEFILAPSKPVPGAEMYGPVHMSAFTARQLGYIDQAECDRLVNDAREATTASMQMWLDHVPDEQVELRAQLTAAMDSPSAFTRIVTSTAYRRAANRRWLHAGHTFRETRTAVPWPRPLTSIAAEIEQSGLRPDELAWITGALFRRFDATLEQSMHHAWKQASHGYRLVSIIATDPD